MITAIDYRKIADYGVSAVPYVFCLYFLEIIFFMPAVIYYYGKTIGFTTVVILSALLSLHLIYLYLRKNSSRIIHLFIMDIHAAFSIGYIVNYLSVGQAAGAIDAAAFSVRILLLGAELFMILCLTSENARRLYR